MKGSLKTKLRIRFVLLATASLFLLQALIVGVSIDQNRQDMVKKSDMLIAQLRGNPEGASRYFSVKIPAGKDTVYTDVIRHVTVTGEEAEALANRALSLGEDKGFLEGYRYHIYRNENGTRIYFLLRESALETCRMAAENMIAVSALSLVLVGVLLIPVSGWVVRPMVENHRKQKEFITAAGHELKTPLTVISTNAQLLETEIGESPWLEGIKTQVLRLTEMTRELVTLSRAEEYHNPPQKKRLSFSDVLREAAEPFETVAKQNRIDLSLQIQDPLPYFGSPEEIGQLVRILLDNACKYCPERGSITASARKTLQGVHLTVTNTAEPLSASAEALVGRFLRGENAVGKEGFGLGLSIARAIVRRHGGNLVLNTKTCGVFQVEVTLR